MKTTILSIALIFVSLCLFDTADAAWQCTPDYSMANPFVNCVATEPEGVIGPDVTQANQEFNQTVNINDRDIDGVNLEVGQLELFATNTALVEMNANDRRAFLFKVERLINMMF